MPRFLLLLLGTLFLSAAQSQTYPNEEQGADAIGGPPETFAEHVRREREKWGCLVRERNIVVN